MKIMLLAPIHDEKAWAMQRSREMSTYGGVRTPFVVGQGQYFWWKALRQLGHDVTVARYTDKKLLSNAGQVIRRVADNIPVGRHRLRGVLARRASRKLNSRLVVTAEETGPDLILLSGGTNAVRAETLERMRSLSGARLALLNGMSPGLFATGEEIKALKLFDLVCTNDATHAAMWEKLGARRAIALPVSGLDAEYHVRPDVVDERFRSEICFVGRLAPDHLYAERVQFLEALTGFNLAIWTANKEAISHSAFLTGAYRGEAFGLDMHKAIAGAKIALNLHGATMPLGGNLRTFEIPALGTCQVVDRFDKSWFEEGQEIVSFSNVSELRAKVAQLLENTAQRTSIAQAGLARALRQHTYLHRMNKLLDLVCPAQ